MNSCKETPHERGNDKTDALGSSDHEIERLDRQSASIEGATRLLLRAAGIQPGMRVLDLGTGVGHVAMLVAEMVGPEGRVVGIDNSARLLDVATARASARPQLCAGGATPSLSTRSSGD